MTDTGLMPELPERVHHLVHRFIAPNAGPKTLGGTNTYVVGQREVVLIDPGPAAPGHYDRLLAWLATADRSVRAILLTHGHPDHVPDGPLPPEWSRAPVWAAPTTPYPGYSAPAHHHLADQQVFGLWEDTLRVIATPGHTPDSVCFLLERAGVLFTGDTVLGAGSTVIAPPEGDMTAYMASLRRLQSVEAALIAPGHGPVVLNARARIDEYLEHRGRRERELIVALGAGPASVAALVEQLYAGTPPVLHDLAAGSITAGLEKLRREGRVSRAGTTWSLVQTPSA